jgi:Cd2+/Zn2+-exporting ATPase
VWIGRPEDAVALADASQASELRDGAVRLREEGKTVSALLVDGYVGWLGFQDALREGARECVAQLKAQGIQCVEMFTGDHEAVVRRLAAELNLDDYRSQMKPEEKRDALARLRDRHGPVMMIGDGVNDAPALLGADVGIAMGARGTDLAIEAADVVLLHDRIESIVWLHRHARCTLGIVRQNVIFALAVIAVLTVFCFLGAVPLPLAVVGHEGSTILVALNALRLLR